MGLPMVLNSNLGPILPVSEILELLYAEATFFHTPLLFGQNFGGVLFGVAL